MLKNVITAITAIKEDKRLDTDHTVTFFPDAFIYFSPHAKYRIDYIWNIAVQEKRPLSRSYDFNLFNFSSFYYGKI